MFQKPKKLVITFDAEEPPHGTPATYFEQQDGIAYRCTDIHKGQRPSEDVACLMNQFDQGRIEEWGVGDGLGIGIALIQQHVEAVQFHPHRAAGSSRNGP